MTTRQKIAFEAFGAFVAAVLAMPCIPASAQKVKMPADPGVRGGAAGAGTPLPGLTADETAFFRDGLVRFAEIEVVTGGNNNGLGPRFNSNQCLSCHSQPAAGGSSPARNPLIGIATLNGAKNVVPWFITQNGPIREARFKRNPNGTNDGGVHNLFVITGRSDAAGCAVSEKSVWNIVMTMRSVWRTAIDWGYTRARIFDHVCVRLAPPGREQRCFSVEDVRRILAAAEEPFRTFCWLAAETGMRAGELCGLQWDDVDYNLQAVRVRRSAWRGYVTSPKTRNGIRTIAMSEALIERLKEIQRTDKKPCAFVFHSRNLTPWDANLTQKRKLVSLLEKLGIERAGFHAFRHFNSTAMNRAGTPSAAMRARLGHSSLIVTDRYTHSVASDELLAAEKIKKSIVPFCASDVV